MAYDLIVIGSGPGGYVCAIRAAQLGLKTAVVEKEKTFGGTCLNIGCIPSKALLHSSELFEEAGHAFAGMGIKVSDPKLDLPAMMKFKDEGVDGNVKGVAFLFKKNKIDSFQGTGSIAGPGKVIVTSADGKTETVETKNIVIATGSDVARLKGIDIDEKRVVSSTGALVLAKVPQDLLVVGAGVIGLELGSVWRRLGAKVQVVEFLDRILPGTDSEVARQFQRLLEKQGMTFKLSSKVTAIDTSGKRLKASIEPAAGGTAETIEADIALVAIGRVPYTAGLGLKEAGVALDNRGRVVIDPHYATNVPGIYAIGDVVAGPMLAHKAEDEGVAVAEIIAGQAGHVNYDVIPNVVYTYPGACLGREERGGIETGRRRLQCRQVPVHRQWPRQGQQADRGLRENSRRRQDRPRARRPHSRSRRRQHDRGSRRCDGIRRGRRRHCAHLPCASDFERGCQGSRAGGRQAVAQHVDCFASGDAALKSAGGRKTLRWEEARMGKGHKDKVAVITGAAAGIGQAFARRLAEDGAHIVIADKQPADDTVKMVKAAGREALACGCDVASPDSVAAMAKEVDRRFGRCDILVNNAGIYPLKPFEQMTFADWRHVMSINLDAAFLTASAFIPGMKQRGWGRIVNMSSSTLGTVVTDYAHYIASKGGVVGFTRALASEFGPFGITVNAISPSLVRSQGTLSRAPRFGRASMDEEFNALAKRQPIPRPELPEDLVGALSFLTSDDAAFLTGQTLYVDGGLVRA